MVYPVSGFMLRAMISPLQSKRYLVLPALLIELRKENNLLQSDLAEKLKKPQSYVSKYERGERRLDLAEFIEICNALNLDPKDVFSNFLEKSSST